MSKAYPHTVRGYSARALKRSLLRWTRGLSRWEAALATFLATTSFILFVVLPVGTHLGKVGHGVCAAGEGPGRGVVPHGERPKYAEDAGVQQSTDPREFTFVMNTFKRPDLLEASVQHYARCSSIESIRVVWSETPDPPQPDTHPHLFPAGKKVIYHNVGDTSLNARFLPHPGLRTEAALSIDDDIIMPCDELDAAHAVWRRHREELVGFFPRATPGKATADGKCGYSYASKWSTMVGHGEYSIILTKAAFMHRDYLEAYTSTVPAEIKDFVREHKNCEDIAMQFVVANLTRTAPILTHTPWVRDKGQGLFKVKGISSLAGHARERSACVDTFAKLFPDLGPLPTRSLSWHGPVHGVALRLSPLLDDLASLLPW